MLRTYGDAVIAAFFSADKPRAREAARVRVEELVGGMGEGCWEKLAAIAATLRQGDHPVRPFHWEIEFPEVFARENPGFDAIVGNPPFAGKNNVIGSNRAGFLDWLQTLHPGAHGNADLVAHFFRRAIALIRRTGAFGLIATNTIGQGDTRASGLAAILNAGGSIVRAVKRQPWPGEAAVIVSVVHIVKGAPLAGEHLVRDEGVAGLPVLSTHCASLFPSPLVGEGREGGAGAARSRSDLPPAAKSLSPSFPHKGGERSLIVRPALNGRPVRRISAYLVEGDLDTSPAPLAANAGKAFQGSIVLGMGFTFDDEAAAKGIASSLDDMRRLIEKDQRNAERIFPYIGGEEVNNDPQQQPHRYAFNLSNLSEVEARAKWPDLVQIADEKVRPERAKKNDERARNLWWQFLRPRGELQVAIAGLPCVLAIPRVSPYLDVARLLAGMIYSDQLVVIAFSNLAPLSVLQSRSHETWARFFSSSMKDDLRYAPSDCFETFPFPLGFEADPALEAAGRAYHEHRAELMVARNEGMTKIYNRFHDHNERAADIVRLRELHAEMDRAVLAAYGWDDLAERAEARFLDEDSEDDHTYQGRFFWPSDFRDEVLARLLALNAERHAEEVRLGVAPGRKGRVAEDDEEATE